MGLINGVRVLRSSHGEPFGTISGSFPAIEDGSQSDQGHGRVW